MLISKRGEEGREEKKREERGRRGAGVAFSWPAKRLIARTHACTFWCSSESGQWPKIYIFIAATRWIRTTDKDVGLGIGDDLVDRGIYFFFFLSFFRFSKRLRGNCDLCIFFFWLLDCRYWGMVRWIVLQFKWENFFL